MTQLEVQRTPAKYTPMSQTADKSNNVEGFELNGVSIDLEARAF